MLIKMINRLAKIFLVISSLLIFSSEIFGESNEAAIKPNFLKEISTKNVYQNHRELNNFTANNYSNKARNFLINNNLNKAMEFSRKAYDIYYEIKDTSNLVEEAEFLSTVFREIKDFNNATKYAEKAYVLYSRLGNKKKCALAASWLSNVFYEMDDLEEAINYSQLAFHLYYELDEIDKNVEEADWLGYYYKKRGEVDKSLFYYYFVINNINENENPELLVENLNNLSFYYMSKPDINQAILFTEKAIRVASNNDLGVEKLKSMVLLSFLLTRVGEIQQAVKCFNQVEEQLKILPPDVISKGLEVENELIAEFFVKGLFSTNLMNSLAIDIGKSYMVDAISLADQCNHKDALYYYLKGMLYFYEGELEKVVKSLEKSLHYLSIDKNFKELKPIILAQCGLMYAFQGQILKATEVIDSSYIICKKTNNFYGLITALRCKLILGFHFTKSYSKMEEILLELIDIFEVSDLNIPGRYSNEIFDEHLLFYELLALCMIYNNKGDEAIRILDQTRGKELAKRLERNNKKINFDFNDLKLNKKILKDDIIVSLDFLNIENNEYFTGKSDFYSKIFDNRNNINKEEGLFTTIADPYLDSTSWYYKSEKFFINDRKESLLDVIGLYNTLLRNQIVDYESLSYKLYNFLFAPIRDSIDNKKQLIVIPDPILSNIPLETLVDEKGNYLIDYYDVQYIQSFAILSLLQNRDYDKLRKPMLAFGGALYNDITFNSIKIEDLLGLNQLKKVVNDSIVTRGSQRKAYASLGYTKWENLPGTETEVINITNIIERDDILLGDDVTENRIKQMSESGELKKYKIIHFATHAVSIPDMPELSALVLSQFKDEKDGEDGYLCMNEIEQLDIKADLVVLSACETGLGKIYHGEGVIGLTRAFMIAGANGVLVSLWQISDESTSIFMTTFYTLVDQGMDFVKALSETKRKFIKGEFGEEYTKPYYWAPYVYYGK